MFDFHMVVIFNEYYTQIVAVFDETDAEQKQKQTVFLTLGKCFKQKINFCLVINISIN